ncbi:Jag N-terminal domain-containing protein [bacterium]|nr:Jag N-terminal domain-containing protein [bacterium]
MESIEVTGKTLEEAIQKALTQLGVQRDDVKVEVLSEEKKGLFGLMGAKPAKIRVTVIRKEKP